MIVLAVCAFVQNMAFTWTSRSRNSGNPNYHRYAAYCSNGIWFITHFFVLKELWRVFDTDAWWRLAVILPIYVCATSEGSVLMMKILLRREKGSHRVGARTIRKQPADPKRREAARKGARV